MSEQIDEQQNNLFMTLNSSLVTKEKIDIDSIKFKKIMFLYESALRTMNLNIELLRDELKLFSNYEPIEYIKTRIKKPSTIIEKLTRRNYSLTYEDMFMHISDIAGLRIVCNFKKDIYYLVERLENIEGIKVISKKDYLQKPKSSGYMSYHMIVEVPVRISDGMVFMKVEIQIRTLAMDFWANIEHKLKYKNDEITKRQSNNLVKYAKVINNIDDNMQVCADKITLKKYEKMVVNAEQALKDNKKRIL